MTCATDSCQTWRCSTKERAGNNFPEFSQSRPSCGTKLWRCGTKLWQGLPTLPLGRPNVSNPEPGGRPTVQQTAGSGDPRRTAPGGRPTVQQTAGSGNPRRTANLKSVLSRFESHPDVMTGPDEPEMMEGLTLETTGDDASCRLDSHPVA